MKKNVPFKRIALIAIAALTGLALLSGLTACKEATEAVIRESLTTELDKLKNPNSTLWSDAGVGEDGGLTTEFVTAWSESYSFEIGEVAVNGDTAIVQISITCKQIGPIMKEITDAALSGEGFEGLTADEITQKVEDLFMDELNKAQPATTEFETVFNKTNNTWLEDTANDQEYMKALMGNL
jgi:hypothetical protein